MQKEIFEQPRSITDTLHSRIDLDTPDVHLADLLLTDDDLRAVEKICTVACGTAWHAGLVGKFLIEALAGVRVEVDYERLRFAYRLGTGEWQWLPQLFDASILSDEATAPGLPNFTGAFVGVACQDLAGTGRPADFDWFEYRERDYAADVVMV
jgi:hypothetical protein